MNELTDFLQLYRMLPKKDKQSVAQQVSDFLKGNGTDPGYLAKLFEKKMTDLSPLDDDEVAKRMEPYRKGIGVVIAKGAGDALADAISTVSDLKGAGKSLLGAALLAGVPSGTTGYAYPVKNAVNPIAAGANLRGMANSTLGKVASTMYHDIADPLADRAEQNRNTELFIRENPSSGFYDYNRSREWRTSQQNRQRHPQK